MEIEKIKEDIEITFYNNDKFKYIGIYIIFLFVIISFNLSGISLWTIIVNLIFFIFMWIGNYICLRKICDTEIIILKNTNLIVKRLWKKKKIVYEKKIFYDEIFKIYYKKQYLNF